MPYECEKCGKTFPIPGRIEATTKEEDAAFNMPPGVRKAKYTVVIKHCCPFCESIEIKEQKPK